MRKNVCMFAGFDYKWIGSDVRLWNLQWRFPNLKTICSTINSHILIKMVHSFVHNMIYNLV